MYEKLHKRACLIILLFPFLYSTLGIFILKNK